MKKSIRILVAGALMTLPIYMAAPEAEACTTILAGKNATADGSTFMGRTNDSPHGTYDAKKFVVVLPEQQPHVYRSVSSGVEIPLPENPLRYTAMPNADPQEKGIWADAGVNEKNIAMSASETITVNPKVLQFDPLIKEGPGNGGIGEEDLVVLVLPYIASAREGVERLGSLLEAYGTYESNGIGFQDKDEIWWLESIGGHHWIARRLPDDSYAVIPNRRSIDTFDFVDAFGEQKDYMCSADLLSFIEQNQLSPVNGNTVLPLAQERSFDVRAAFGTSTKFDGVYSNCRTWDIGRRWSRTKYQWDGSTPDYSPESPDIPWSMVPDRKISLTDLKAAFSANYEETLWDPLTTQEKRKYRPIAIDRTEDTVLTQIRGYMPSEISAVEWISEGCNEFNAFVPFYANVTATPAYMANVTSNDITSDNFYWANRLISAAAAPYYDLCHADITAYQATILTEGQKLLSDSDRRFIEENPQNPAQFLEGCNERVSLMAKNETTELLHKILRINKMNMRLAYDNNDPKILTNE